MNSNDCPICFGQMQDGSMVELSYCPHRFCLTCIGEWCVIKNTCPLCRQEFIVTDEINAARMNTIYEKRVAIAKAARTVAAVASVGGAVVRAVAGPLAVRIVGGALVVQSVGRVVAGERRAAVVLGALAVGIEAGALVVEALIPDYAATLWGRFHAVNIAMVLLFFIAI